MNIRDKENHLASILAELDSDSCKGMPAGILPSLKVLVRAYEAAEDIGEYQMGVFPQHEVLKMIAHLCIENIG